MNDIDNKRREKKEEREREGGKDLENVFNEVTPYKLALCQKMDSVNFYDV